MEPQTIQRVVNEATLHNYFDLLRENRGDLTTGQVRMLAVADALVDTEATFLSVPTSLLRKLGLAPVEKGMYEPVRLTIQGRCCTLDVLGALIATR